MDEKTSSKNIADANDDVFFRYKRDRIVLVYTKKKGGQIRIANMDDIQKQLRVPDEFITAFYKRVHKTGVAMSNRQPGCQPVMSANITVEKLEQILDYMIRKYVLCPVCGLPERDFSKSGRCNSCGN